MEVGEGGDGLWDGAREVGDTDDVEEVKVREVGDGGRDGKGVRVDVDVGEGERVDAVVLAVVAVHTLPAVAAVGGRVP